MKTIGMAHQQVALERMDGRDKYALFMEQGTGKTWDFMADAEREYNRGHIDGLFVLAPKGVDSNWVLREVPAHLEVPHIAHYFRSGASVKKKKEMEGLFLPREHGQMPPLRILAMNYEALLTDEGYTFAERFLRTITCMGVLDESRRIKNNKSARTKAVMSLRKLIAIRRIGTGTPMANKPLDVFQQMEFLESGLLGTTSFRAFTAEYADLVAEDSPLMRHIQMRTNNKFAKPQVIARNEDGTFRWRNLDQLQKLLEPYSYRVLKKDCLDLPEKIYKTRFYELPPKARKLYNSMRDKLRIEFGDGIITAQRLDSLIKLQQINSGFVVPAPKQPEVLIETGIPTRLKTLLDIIEDIPENESFIIFSRFRYSMEMIATALRGENISFVEYHGDTKDAARIAAINDFQARKVRGFSGQIHAGGIGLTLTAATHVIYYENTFDDEDRLQSEDRAHRIGTTGNVVYTDIAAVDTIDEKITLSAQRKQNISAAVLGDFRLGKSVDEINSLLDGI